MRIPRGEAYPQTPGANHRLVIAGPRWLITRAFAHQADCCRVVAIPGCKECGARPDGFS